MLKEIKQLNLSEEILKKYDIKSIQVMSEGNLEPAIHSYIKLKSSPI
jgi:hypothetical protein